MRKDVDEKIVEFSNRKEVAEKADLTLSQLIQKKSPLILSWIEKRNLITSTADQIARQWRLYYAHNFVLSKYPHDDLKVNIQIEKLVDKSIAKHSTKAFRKKLERLFTIAQISAIQTVEGFKLKEASQVLNRLRSIQLYWPEKLKSARNHSLPLDLISWGLAYDPTVNEINVGLEALIYPNDDTFLAVLAHEIGHSIDSCRWGAFFHGAWPFEKVGECLRSGESVGAKKRDDSKMQELVNSNQLSAELAASLKLNPTCNKLVYPPTGLQADQLPESFADWFSAEVVSSLGIKSLSRFRVDLCEEKNLKEGSSYPTNADRLEKIYFANPHIRGLLTMDERKRQEKSGVRYCQFNMLSNK